LLRQNQQQQQQQQDHLSISIVICVVINNTVAFTLPSLLLSLCVAFFLADVFAPAAAI